MYQLIRLYEVTPKPGHFVRISESPLMEWHGFACIPVPKEKGFSLVVSKAGDWTSDKIANPRSKLWVRGVPCYGVLRITPLFRRVVFVATGSGIGPCAPCIFEQRVPIKLLWTSPNVRETFGNEFVDKILESAPGAVVYGEYHLES
jgi:NAD(P)H-flavin reductase